MIDIVGLNCCGCTACNNICNSGCISMVANDEGFLYPSVDYNKCINCGLCETVCPVLNKKNEESGFYKDTRKTYSAVSVDRNSLKSSSSGGVFSVLAEETLKQDGCVFGASFSDCFRNVEHKCIDDVRELEQLKGSKYLQSDLKNSFSLCKKHLEKGKKVLFSGVPCQIAGLKKYLGKDYSNLVCVEVICHGVPSPLVWQKYLDAIESKLGKTESVTFRDKSAGWDSFGMKIQSSDGKELIEIHQANSYMAVFLKNLALRESCYVCPAKGENSCADMTLGDFWGLTSAYPEFYDDGGVSVVVIHTSKGQKMIENVSDRLVLHETDLNKSLEDNWIIYRSVSRPRERDVFYHDLKHKSWEKIERKYLEHPSFKEQIYSFLRRVKRATIG